MPCHFIISPDGSQPWYSPTSTSQPCPKFRPTCYHVLLFMALFMAVLPHGCTVYTVHTACNPKIHLVGRLRRYVQPNGASSSGVLTYAFHFNLAHSDREKCAICTRTHEARWGTKLSCDVLVSSTAPASSLTVYCIRYTVWLIKFLIPPRRYLRYHLSSPVSLNCSGRSSQVFLKTPPVPHRIVPSFRVGWYDRHPTHYGNAKLSQNPEMRERYCLLVLRLFREIALSSTLIKVDLTTHHTLHIDSATVQKQTHRNAK